MKLAREKIRPGLMIETSSLNIHILRRSSGTSGEWDVLATGVKGGFKTADEQLIIDLAERADKNHVYHVPIPITGDKTNGSVTEAKRRSKKKAPKPTAKRILGVIVMPGYRRVGTRRWFGLGTLGLPKTH